MKKYPICFLFMIFSIIGTRICADIPEYELIDLNIRSCHFGGLVINNNGIIAGQESEPNIVRSFVLNSLNNDIIYLEPLDGSHMHIYDINNKNEVIGFSYVEVFDSSHGRVRKIHPFIYSPVTGVSDLVRDIGIIDGKYIYECLKINDIGNISGYGCSCVCNDNDYCHANSSFIFENSTNKIHIVSFQKNEYYEYHVFIDSVNNRNQSCGTIGYSGSKHEGFAFFRDGIKGEIVPLGNLCENPKYYSQSVDINDNGQIVGNSELNKKNKDGFYVRHACLWNTGSIIDLGSLSPEGNSYACAINNHCVVVGNSNGTRNSGHKSQPFVWDFRNGMRNLNDLIVKEGVEIIYVTDINDAGQIVGFAKIRGEEHIILLNPLI